MEDDNGETRSDHSLLLTFRPIRQTIFETTPVMSAYLIAFAIGDFDVLSAPTKQNVVVRVYFPPCTIPPLF